MGEEYFQMIPELASGPIPVVLSNRWALFRCSGSAQAILKPYFAYDIPGANFSEAYRNGSWDGRKNLMARGRVATGLFLAKQAELEQAGFQFQITDIRKAPEFQKAADPKDREYQIKAVEAMIAASNTGGLVLCATGTGKTRLSASFFKRLIGSAVFVCDELTLLEQSRLEIGSVLNEEVGVVGHSEFHPKRITVATIQTLSKHRNKPIFRKWFTALNVVVIDEIHTALNRRNIDIVSLIQPQAVFGLTATLQIQKPHVQMPAMALAGPVIFEYSIQEGVEAGYLSSGTVCHLRFNDALQGIAPGYESWGVDKLTRRKKKIWIKAGSPEADYRYHICLNKARNDCVEALVREGIKRGRRVVVLVERRIHLAVLARRFPDIPHQALSGQRESSERFAAMKAMDAGELPLILASRVFGKGVNLQKVDLILDGSALPGRDGAIQRYGRGVRKSGKKKLIYIDIADHGNKHAWSAQLRAAALQEVCTQVVQDIWKGDAGLIFDQIELVSK